MKGQRKAKIWDLDGTLVNVRGILHLLGQKNGFDSFHRASSFCPPNTDVVRAARQSHEEGYANLIFTGRTEQYRALSVDWLGRNWVPYTHMWMRADGDYRKDFVVKREMYDEASRVYEIIHATDDRPEIVALWNHLGVPVTVIPGWEEFRQHS